jgi:hypothetical protein
MIIRLLKNLNLKGWLFGDLTYGWVFINQQKTHINGLLINNKYKFLNKT